jgi:NAD(P)-dependent dehydrogenase (short-subunit alcohol dehydrogenase family)
VDGLTGKRVLVIGASSGIGQAVGMNVAKAGGRVAFAARRRDLCEQAAASAGAGSIALQCDVRDSDACEAVVGEAAKAFGGLDAFVFATGVSPLTRLTESGADEWRMVFETNVIGANLICRAALPHLRASGGRAVFLSSSSVGRPYPALVAYAASKAALEESIRGWRAENPDMSFSCIVVGPTAGTEFGTTWDPERTMEMLTFWDEHGYPATDSFMSLDDMASAVVQVLASPICVQHVVAFADRSTPAG